MDKLKRKAVPGLTTFKLHFKINYPYTEQMVDSSQLTFLPTSKSHDTKTKPNIKNPALSNLDIVP